MEQCSIPVLYSNTTRATSSSLPPVGFLCCLICFDWCSSVLYVCLSSNEMCDGGEGDTLPSLGQDWDSAHHSWLRPSHTPITFGGGYGQQLLHALVLGLRPCGSRDWPHPLARDLLPNVVRLCLV